MIWPLWHLNVLIISWNQQIWVFSLIIFSLLNLPSFSSLPSFSCPYLSLIMSQIWSLVFLLAVSSTQVISTTIHVKDLNLKCIPKHRKKFSNYNLVSRFHKSKSTDLDRGYGLCKWGEKKGKESWVILTHASVWEALTWH